VKNAEADGRTSIAANALQHKPFVLSSERDPVDAANVRK